MTSSIDCGPVRRWREGDILHAENDFIRMAYVVTDDPSKIGQDGWHPYRDTEMIVGFISPETGRLWDNCERRE